MKTNAIISFLFFIFLIGNSYAQYVEGAYEGEEMYGNYGANAVKNVPEDGYILVGSMTTTYPDEKNQVYVLRISDSLEQRWSRTIEVEGQDWGNSVELTRDRGFLIAGTSEIIGTGRKYIYLIKIDSSGEIEWSKHLGDKDHNQEGNAIRATDDGGFIIVGSIEKQGLGKDVYVVKLDADGDVEWSKSIGGSGDEIGYGVNTALDGGYIIVGESDSFTPDFYESYIIKLDAVGNLEWASVMAPNLPNKAHDVVATADGGYAVAGNHVGRGYILKLDSAGEMEWWKGYGLTNYTSYLYSISLLDNGNIVAVGNVGEVSFFAVESTIDGEFRRSREYWGQEGYRAYTSDLADDAGFIMAGVKNRRGRFTGDRIYFIKTRPSLFTCVSSLARYTANPIRNFEKRSGGMIQNENANLFDVVSVEGESLDIFPICSTVLDMDDFIKPEFSIYPNPAKNYFTVDAEGLILRIEISTLDGKRIYAAEVRNHTATISTRDFSAGMYLVTIHSEAGISTKKVMVSK